MSAARRFWPSGFSRVRGQYPAARYSDREGIANELLLQVLFTIGAHDAHAF